MTHCEEEVRTPGSARACPSSLRCGAQQVVDNARCRCAPMGCSDDEVLLLAPSGALRCVKEAPFLCASSPPCPAPDLALHALSCACERVRVSPCLPSGGGATWRSDDGSFFCVPT